MRRRTSLLRGLAVLALAVPTLLLPAAAHAAPADELDAVVDASGVGLVVAAGDTVVYSRDGATGVDQVVPIASASKLVSATVIMALVDRGEIDLDAPVADYLAGSPVTWPARKQAITMRMLLSHTSGLRTNGCIDDATTLQGCVQTIANAPLASAPGSTFSYGGTSYQVAGYVAELASGLTWAELVQQYVSGPLDMPTLTFGATANPRIAGGALSSATDYLHLLQMHLAGGVYGGATVLSPESVAEMQGDLTAGLAQRANPGARYQLGGYGLAWWIRNDCARPGTAGPELSDPGATGFIGVIDPSIDQAVVVTTNQGLGAGEAAYSAARPHVVELLTGTAPPAPTC
jgi:CubicO group peptidase (beta-lactamase class C family)